MFNPYKRLLALIPDHPLQVGDVAQYSNGVATVTLPGGGVVQVRGDTTVGARVFFRDGLIEGPAPSLPVELIDL